MHRSIFDNNADHLKHYEIEVRKLRNLANNNQNAKNHIGCRSEIDKLTELTKTLKTALEKEVKQRDRYIQIYNLNPHNQAVHHVNLSKCSPEVQRLKIENTTLRTQLAHNYYTPEVYFKKQDLIKTEELNKIKDQQIFTLKKQLALLKREAVALKERSLEMQIKEKYDNLLNQNQEFKRFLSIPIQQQAELKTIVSPEATHQHQQNLIIQQQIAGYSQKIKELQLAKQVSMATCLTLRKHNQQLNDKCASYSSAGPNSAKIIAEFEEKIKRIEQKNGNLKNQIKQAEALQLDYLDSQVISDLPVDYKQLEKTNKVHYQKGSVSIERQKAALVLEEQKQSLEYLEKQKDRQPIADSRTKKKGFDFTEMFA